MDCLSSMYVLQSTEIGLKGLHKEAQNGKLALYQFAIAVKIFAQTVGSTQ